MSITVLHVVESLSPQAGSVAVTLPGLFHALLSEDIAVSCLTANDPLSEAEIAHLTQSQTSLAENLKVFGQANLDQALTSSDLVHIHGWDTEFLQQVASSAGKRGAPVVLSPLGALCESSFRSKTIREKLRNLLPSKSDLHGITALAAMHELEAAALSDRGVRVETLPYGLDTAGLNTASDSGASSEARLDKDSSDKLVLYLGPIDPAEGVVMLLKSFAELGSVAQTWHITLAGPDIGDWRSQLEAAVDRKGAGQRVRFVEASNVAAQQTLIESAGLVVAPTLSMRFPLTVMQAACLATPVLATSLTTPDAIQDMVNTCPPARGEFKMALRAMLEQNDGTRRSAATATLALAREKLDWSRCVERFIQLYRSLVK